MKNRIVSAWQSLSTFRREIYYFCFGLMLLGMFGQLLGLSSLIAENTAPRSILRAYDNDGHEAIAVADRTTLWNDNRWRPYGPVYYRLVHLFSRATVWPDYKQKNTNYEEVHQIGINFYLQFVNFLFLYGFAYLVAWALTRHLLLQVLICQVLAMVLLQDPVWAKMALRPHPDYVLVFFVGLAALITGRFFQKTSPEEQDKYWKWSAWVWGIVAATKLTFLLFIPALIIPLLRYPRSQWGVKFWSFFKNSIFAYLLVGFPQNLDFPGTIGFLLKQSRNSNSPDGESFNNWINLFESQLLLPLAIVFACALLVPLRNKRIGGYSAIVSIWALGFFLMPTLILFSRKINPPFAYYPMPFVAMLLVGCVFLAPSLVRTLRLRVIEKVAFHGATSLAIFLITPFLVVAIPNSVPERIYNNTKCHQGYYEIKQKVHRAIDAGFHVLGGPYTPFLESKTVKTNGQKNIDTPWEVHPEMIRKNETRLIVLRPFLYKRYIPKEMGGTKSDLVHHVEKWEQTTAFYMMFFKKDQTTDQYGQNWKKTAFKCGFEIWERQDSGAS